MIAYVTGVLGAGKSYYGARKIADALLRGKVVATNVQLVPGWEKIVLSHSPYYRASKSKESYERDMLSRYCFEPDIEYLVSATIKGKGESRGVRVIDEAHNEINNREWLQANQKQVLRRMALARKRGWDDYILAQHKDNTDMALRRIAGVEIRLINWRQMLILPFFQTQLLPFHLFLAMAYPMNNHLRREKKVMWRELYKLSWQAKIYDTFEDFDERHNVHEVDDFSLRYPRLPVPGGYDSDLVHAENMARIDAKDGLQTLLDSDDHLVQDWPKPAKMKSRSSTEEVEVPFKPATPTVSAKGIDRADVLSLLESIPALEEGQFSSDEVKYADRPTANAVAAKYIRVAESIDHSISLRSRTWEAPDGSGWFFGIRTKAADDASDAAESNGGEPAKVEENKPAAAKKGKAA